MQSLLEGRLLGTGNVARRLSTLGFPLRFEQSALHEFDFSVNVLAVDLRDGIRLCKLTAMLTGASRPHSKAPAQILALFMECVAAAMSLRKLHTPSCSRPSEHRWQLQHKARDMEHACLAGVQGLLQAARFPLDKRPLQIHNINLALTALHQAGIDAQVGSTPGQPRPSRGH